MEILIFEIVARVKVVNYFFGGILKLYKSVFYMHITSFTKNNMLKRIYGPENIIKLKELRNFIEICDGFETINILEEFEVYSENEPYSVWHPESLEYIENKVDNLFSEVFNKIPEHNINKSWTRDILFNDYYINITTADIRGINQDQLEEYMYDSPNVDFISVKLISKPNALNYIKNGHYHIKEKDPELYKFIIKKENIEI